jgi:hypothetical protein
MAALEPNTSGVGAAAPVSGRGAGRRRLHSNCSNSPVEACAIPIGNDAQRRLPPSTARTLWSFASGEANRSIRPRYSSGRFGVARHPRPANSKPLPAASLPRVSPQIWLGTAGHLVTPGSPRWFPGRTPVSITTSRCQQTGCCSRFQGERALRLQPPRRRAARGRRRSPYARGNRRGASAG